MKQQERLCRPLLKRIYIPVPESGTVTEETLLVIFNEPVRVPIAVGLKTTLAVQLAPGAYDVPS